jgi:hypothetical protein
MWNTLYSCEVRECCGCGCVEGGSWRVFVVCVDVWECVCTYVEGVLYVWVGGFVVLITMSLQTLSLPPFT